MASVAYNQDDPLQSAFLSTLAKGETGGASYAATEGTGGQNLAGSPADQYGFPEWSGVGNSHAAGIYQFQPGTWAGVASQYNLNFQNPQDQAAGAWYVAQQTYAANTGGGSLEQALQSGNYSGIQSALSKVWTSVTGNANLPQGLAPALSSAVASGGTAATNATAAANSGQGGTTQANTTNATSSGGLLGSLLGNSFNRLILLVIGAVVIFVALWMLLSNAGVVPSPSSVASKTGKALAL